jgi:hypothetical protein
LYSIFSCPPTTKYFTNNYKGDKKPPTYDLPTSKKNVYPKRDLYHHAVTVGCCWDSSWSPAQSSVTIMCSFRDGEGSESTAAERLQMNISLKKKTIRSTGVQDGDRDHHGLTFSCLSALGYRSNLANPQCKPDKDSLADKGFSYNKKIKDLKTYTP